MFRQATSIVSNRHDWRTKDSLISVDLPSGCIKSTIPVQAICAPLSPAN